MTEESAATKTLMNCHPEVQKPWFESRHLARMFASLMCFSWHKEECLTSLQSPRDPVVPSQQVMCSTPLCRYQEGPVVPNLRFGTTGSIGVVSGPIKSSNMPLDFGPCLGAAGSQKRNERSRSPEPCVSHGHHRFSSLVSHGDTDDGHIHRRIPVGLCTFWL